MALVEVAGLTKLFGSVAAVKDVSFAIAEGRTVALLGPNGAGKSTCLNILVGLLRPTSGTVGFEGFPAGFDRRALIGYLPQQVTILGWMTGAEYLVLIGELFGLPRAQAKDRADELLKILGLEEAGNRRVAGYSGGMKQRLGVAQALVHRPRLLILDEPVSGLDPVGRRDLLELLKRLKNESTIIFSTHVLPDAEELSDDVLIIRDGEIVVADTLAALREQNEQPIVDVEFESEAAAREWNEHLASAGGSIELRHAIIRFRYDASDEMRRSVAAIYRVIADQEMPVRRVEMGQTTLEDLFLKIVQQ